MCFIIFPIILFSWRGADIFEPQNMPIRKQFVPISFETVFAIGFDQIGYEKSQQTSTFLVNLLELVSTLSVYLLNVNACKQLLYKNIW